MPLLEDALVLVSVALAAAFVLRHVVQGARRLFASGARAGVCGGCAGACGDADARTPGRRARRALSGSSGGA